MISLSFTVGQMDICLCVLFQAHQENQLALTFPSRPRGVIQPGTSQEIPVCLLAKAAGALRHTLPIAVFGSVLPPLVSVCVCVWVFYHYSGYQKSSFY